MRRYLIIFFIVFLPLQFAWGAAARYCVHEKADKVSHFGHHAHVHTVSVPEIALTGDMGGTDDPDCNYCHLSCAQPLPSNGLDFSAVFPAIFEPPDPLLTQYWLPDTIERPNWTVAA